MHDAQSTGDARRAADARDRVTVDLRGLGARLNAEAADRQMSAAALVRHALVELLGQAPSDEDDQHADVPHHAAAQATPIKVTLRISAVHAVLLARRARAADVSQGRYVASLIEGMPVPPQPPDHSRTVTALLISSDRLAVLAADLSAFVRLLGRVPNSQLEPYRASIHALSKDVRAHLATSAELVASLRPPRGR